MKPIEIVELIKAENPELLGKMTDKKAASIVRATLAQLKQQINEVEEGPLKVGGFGRFQVRNKEKEKDGEMVKIKTVTFIASKPKAAE
ncbi:hypothetical protein JCM14076_11380 [Methylosoma difficile]